MGTQNGHDSPERILAGMIADAIRSAGTRRMGALVAEELARPWSAKGALRRAAAWCVKKTSTLLAGADRTGSPRLSADLGRFVTAWAHKINEDHARRPDCHAAARKETIEGFIEHTDFGELREAFQGAAPCVLGTIGVFNEALWKYPAKVGSILGALLEIVNTAVASLSELLAPIERKVGPDLLADLVLSLLRKLDAQALSALANRTFETIRRLHTGSLLLSRSGRPLFQVYLTEKLEEFLSKTDPVLFVKAKKALDEDRVAVAGALADALSKHPGFVTALVAASGAVATNTFKCASRKASLMDDLDREALSQAVSEALGGLDLFELGQALETVSRVFNDLYDLRPDLVRSTMAALADSLAGPEFTRALGRVFAEALQAFSPLLEDLKSTSVGMQAARGGAS
ncbi:MAG TPA: hypothetical protein PLS81_02910 [Deltaproteobacteria bacterium]|nr:hypothetical protein [Deltaproteobacteria bacterium]HOM28391.1 hypothetical protein [Deltaproteobacteria bacterium]HPP80273.1 hypothetical protein [Deltaproteobacteria bacterium]